LKKRLLARQPILDAKLPQINLLRKFNGVKIFVLVSICGRPEAVFLNFY
jgi:hypothetical protein